MRRIPMHMQEWVTKLDGFLQLNDHKILGHAGKVSHDMAVQHATDEYHKFHQQRLEQEVEQADQEFEALAQQINKLDNKQVK